jgi:NET1-associated nuclear protein 1 (U3 small nucleolar RNA-associated protein 17)
MPLVACSSEYVCVVDDSSVDVYSAATLNTLHRAVPTGSFLIHVALRGSGSLHCIDVAGCHTVLDLRTNTTRPVRRLAVDASTPSGETYVAASHFVASHLDEDGGVVSKELCFVLVSSAGEISLHPSRPGSATAARRIGHMPRGDAKTNMLLSVGLDTGVVAVAGHSETVMRLWVPSAPCVYNAAPAVVPVNLAMTALAVHPTGYAVAAGGARGEVMVLRDAIEPHLGGFSDHWHHTPVSALVFGSGGNVLMSGAGEGVICLWSLGDFAMEKLRTKVGGVVHAIVAAGDSPQLAVAPTGRGSLVLIDMAERRATRRRDGVHWSASHPCSDVVVCDWMGTPAVTLTGLPDVLRVFDPSANDTLHALTVTPNLETVQRPPTVGITHVASLRRGRTLVTFENAADLALPSVLRWWRWDESKRDYQEDQCAFAPHEQEPLVAILAIGDDAIITVSASVAKCWAPLAGTEAADAAARGKTSVAAPTAALMRSKAHCVSEVRSTGGRPFTAASLSPDNAVAFIAEDDCVACFNVSAAASERSPWPRVLTLAQCFTAEPVRRTEMVGTSVIASTASTVWAVPLVPGQSPKLLHSGSPVLSACGVAGGNVAMSVTAAKGEVELRVVSVNDGALVAATASGMFADVVSIRAFDASSIAVVSRSRGLRLVKIPAAAGLASEDSVANAPAAQPVSSSSSPPVTDKRSAGPRPTARGLAAFFRAAAQSTEEASDPQAAQASRQRTKAAEEWLSQCVGAGEATAAPGISIVLDGYLSALVAQPTGDTASMASAQVGS